MKTPLAVRKVANRITRVLSDVLRIYKGGQPSAQLQVYLLCFLVSALVLLRLPMFVDLKVPFIMPDTTGYFEITRNIELGRIPTFELRTPGLPLIWFVIRLFSNQALWLVAFQCVVSILTAIFILIAIARYVSQYYYPVYVAILLFYTSSTIVRFDLTLLTESLYTNALIAFFASLFLFLKVKQTGFAWLSSLFATLVILIRPALALIVFVLVLAALYAWFCSRARSSVFALFVPLVTVVLLLITYNIVTIGYLGYSPQVAWARQWFASLVVAPDQRFSEELNRAIEQKNDEIPEPERQILLYSWNLDNFHDTVERYLTQAIWPLAATYGGPTFYSKPRFQEQLTLMNQIADVAFDQNPNAYLKNILVGQWDFWKFSTSYYDWDLYGSEWERNYSEIFSRYPADFLNQLNLNSFSSVSGAVHSPSLLAANGLLQFRAWISPENFIGWFYFIGFALFLYKRVNYRKLLSPLGIWWTSLLVFWLGNSVALAYIGVVDLRYVNTIKFIYYLSLAVVLCFFPLRNNLKRG